jgi:hypothetical protein
LKSAFFTDDADPLLLDRLDRDEVGRRLQRIEQHTSPLKLRGERLQDGIGSGLRGGFFGRGERGDQHRHRGDKGG